MLIEDSSLYQELENVLRHLSFAAGYAFVHAIHEPEFGVYEAAADLHEEGETYNLLFTITDDDCIRIDFIERWFMG